MKGPTTGLRGRRGRAPRTPAAARSHRVTRPRAPRREQSRPRGPSGDPRAQCGSAPGASWRPLGVPGTQGSASERDRRDWTTPRVPDPCPREPPPISLSAPNVVRPPVLRPPGPRSSLPDTVDLLRRSRVRKLRSRRRTAAVTGATSTTRSMSHGGSSWCHGPPRPRRIPPWWSRRSRKARPPSAAPNM